MSVAAGLADAVGGGLAGVGLAARDHHLGAEFCQKLRRRAADAAARAGDDGYSACEIERGGLHRCLPKHRHFRGARSASPESITTIGGYGFRACAKWRIP